MRIPFRQGIVKAPANFLTLSGSTVSLSISPPDATIVAFADGQTNYLFVERIAIANAWTGPFSSGSTTYWLYWEIDPVTGLRSFGHTTRQPVVAASAPSSPQDGQAWFDTTTNHTFVWNSTISRWVRHIRVYAAALVNGSVLQSMGHDTPAFTGTQVSNLANSACNVGTILFDAAEKPLLHSDGTFVTTEDALSANPVSTSLLSVGAYWTEAIASATIPAYSIVYFNDFHRIQLLTSYVSSVGPYGIIDISTNAGDPVHVITQGIVSNPAWNWASAGVNAALYVGSDGLLTTTASPDSVVIARVIDPTTVIMQPTAQLVAPMIQPSSDITLSVDPVDPDHPIAVGDNDPRMSSGVQKVGDSMTGPLILNANPSTSLGAATKQYVDTAVTSINVNSRVSKAGDIMSGPLTLAGDPTSALGAATKQYVDAGLSTQRTAIEGELTSATVGMLTGTYDGSFKLAQIQNTNGSLLSIDETLCWDINYWLTPAEIADSRAQNGPTINLTAKIQGAINALVARFVGPPNPAAKSASMAGVLKFHHSYLIDGLDWHPAIGICGDNMRDTILVQSTTPNGHFLRGLARNGQLSGARSPYATISDITLQGKNVLSAGNAITHGLWLEDSSADPENVQAGGVLAHNAVIMDRVTIVNFSGAGLYVTKKRHGPKVRFSYFSANGNQKANSSGIVDGTGLYSPNVYDNSDSDAEYLHNGNGGAGGDSYFFQNGETTQVNGGDCWSSKNPEQGYYSIRAYGMDYLIIRGVDINGAVYYKGNAPVSSQVRLIGNNFRFRLASFGTDDDTGQPAPLDGYIFVEDGGGVYCCANTFTPYYAGSNLGGIVQARPKYVYKAIGQTVIHSFDRFQDVNSNDWPAGDNLALPTSELSIINSWDKISLCAGSVNIARGQATLFNALRIPDGVHGGIMGRKDGADVPSGFIGESASTVATPVALTSNANTTIVTASLTPGVYDVSCGVLYEILTGTPSISLIRHGFGTTSGAITTTNPITFGERMLNLVATTTGRFAVDRIGPMRIVITTTTPYYLVVRCNFTSGTIQATGYLTVTRVG